MPLPANWVDDIGMQVDADYLNESDETVNELSAARTISDTYAKMVNGTDYPAADHEDAMYFPTDTDAVYHSNGSSWVKVRMAGVAADFLADPPSGMTAFNSASIAADKDGRVLTAPSTGSYSLTGEYQSLSPTTNYTAVAHITVSRVLNAQYTFSGLVLRDGDGQMITYGPTRSNSNGGGLTVYQWTNATTVSSPLNDLAISTNPLLIPTWLRIRDDATTRYFEYSFNGYDWITQFSGTRTTFLTATLIGWGASNTSGSSIDVRMRSFKVS